MHLLVPFACDISEACRHVLGDLALPNLARLLAVLTPMSRDDAEASTFSPPHERAIATAWGWSGGDGLLPFAADAAMRDGVIAARSTADSATHSGADSATHSGADFGADSAAGDAPGTSWGLVTPAYWQLGRDHVAMTDPAALALTDAESRELFGAVRELFESVGFASAYGHAERWYIGRDDLAGYATASLDRVIGRSVDGWLGAHGSSVGGLLRRLQSEVQLVFHEHAVNEAREARGELVVNSFWLSGCGRAQAVDTAATPRIDTTLRAPWLAGDWAAWADAWHALDAGAIAACLGHVGRGEATAITLCGERSAAHFALRPRPLWQRLHARWTGVEPQALLQGL